MITFRRGEGVRRDTVDETLSIPRMGVLGWPRKHLSPTMVEEAAQAPETTGEFYGLDTPPATIRRGSAPAGGRDLRLVSRAGGR